MAYHSRRGRARVLASAYHRRRFSNIAGAGRSGADALYRFRQLLLEPEPRETRRHGASAHLHLRHRPLRGLAPQGLGGFICSLMVVLVTSVLTRAFLRGKTNE